MRRYVLVEDIVRVIFEELDFERLQRMLDSDRDTRSEMIEIIYLGFICVHCKMIYEKCFTHFRVFGMTYNNSQRKIIFL
jgi:hypothetical protein